MPRIPLTWLAEHVELPAGLTAEQLAADLVRVGLEEEAIHAAAVTGPLDHSLMGEPDHGFKISIAGGNRWSIPFAFFFRRKHKVGLSHVWLRKELYFVFYSVIKFIRVVRLKTIYNRFRCLILDNGYQRRLP